MKKRILSLFLSLLVLLSFPINAFAGSADDFDNVNTDTTENQKSDVDTKEVIDNNDVNQEDKNSTKSKTITSDGSKKVEVDTTENTAPKPTVKKKTKITGIRYKKTLKPSDKMEDKITVTVADKRKVYLQMYSSKSKKWISKKSFQTTKSGSQTVKLTYPKDWKKKNRSKWRIYIKTSNNATSFISKPIIIVTRNRSDLDLSAKSAIIIRVDNGDILYGKNMHTKRYMASTTKVMTGILGIENKNLQSVFQITEKAAKTPYSMHLVKNDKFYFYSLLHATLISSDNGSATAIAENTAGSVSKFTKLMNNKAKSLGCKHTHYTNAHGIHSSKHYSTAYDTALITKYAMKNSTFCKIVKKKSASLSNIKGNRKYKVRTTNKLLGKSGILGGKTGWTEKAGGCYTGEFKYKGVKYVTVVLKSKNEVTRFNDTKKLIGYVKKYH